MDALILGGHDSAAKAIPEAMNAILRDRLTQRQQLDAAIPILRTSLIPGCEAHNARYFSEHGMRVYIDRPDDMPQAKKRPDSSCCQAAFLLYASTSISS